MEKESEKTTQHFGGLSRIWQAFFYSLAGLKAVFKEEAAFRQEVYIGILLAITAFFLPVTGWERFIMLASWVFVLIVEVLNSAIEGLCDFVCKDHDPRIGRIKDMGSAAVFLAILFSVSLWTWVLWPLL